MRHSCSSDHQANQLNRVDEFLAKAVPMPDLLRVARAQSALRQWDAVVGQHLASRSWPDRFERGTVWVAVEGSAWAQELRMRKDQILRRLAEISGEPDLFRQVRFGVRTLPKPEPETTERPAEISSEEYAQRSIREIAEQRLREWKASQ